MDTLPKAHEYPADYPFEPTDPVERDRQLAEALADVDAGKGIPNDAVRAWLLKMSIDGFSPPPWDL